MVGSFDHFHIYDFIYSLNIVLINVNFQVLRTCEELYAHFLSLKPAYKQTLSQLNQPKIKMFMGRKCINPYNSSQPSKFNIPRCLTFYLYFFVW